MSFRAQAFVLGVLVCACAHSADNSRPAQTTTTAGSFTLPGSGGSPNEPTTSTEAFSAGSLELAQPEHPANRIATAACERKQECDDIGAAKQYATSQACLTASRQQAHEMLDAMGCENGLNMNAFDTCQAEVRKAECIDIDKMNSLDACNGKRLCLR